MDRLERKIDRALTVLEGSDDGDPPGMKIRVDRLEQKQESSTFWTRTALGGAVAALIAWIVQVVQTASRGP